ncbi:MAG: lysophospholipase L1-like esterase [Verrucomicrobiales bacterium]|jgi:lysophospholipase L1-like esterase
MKLRSLLSLGFLLFAVGNVRADAPKHSAMAPVPRGGGSWGERAKLLNQRVQDTQDTELVFIGDSITQGWEGSGKDIWEERYAAYKAVNLGIGGDRTQHVIYRLQNGNLKGIKPKAAVIMIGTNNSNGIDSTAGQIIEGVGEIVAELKAKTPNTKILLLGIFPRGENINEQRGKLLQINQVLAKHDNGDTVRYLDIGHHFLTMEGLIPAEIMPDYLHLSPAGYKIWADAIDPHLKGWLDGDETAAIDESPMIGKWIFTIQGPEGEDVDMPLAIAAKGGEVTGKMGSAERSFPLDNAKIEGDAISFTVSRDRPNGGTMTYAMKGAFKDGKFSGKVSTKMEDQEVEQDWRARRSE